VRVKRLEKTMHYVESFVRKNAGRLKNLLYRHVIIKNAKKRFFMAKIYIKTIEISSLHKGIVDEEFDIDNEVAKLTMYGWIDFIENDQLFAAIEDLSAAEKELLSYYFSKMLTQKEIARRMHKDRSAVTRKLNNILKKLKKELLFKKNKKISKKVHQT
jgi:RNA polymerase sigma factor (sigma-70 family)